VEIKKKIFFVIKSTLILIAFLTVILFFYTAFFYEKSSIEKQIVKNEKIAEEILAEEQKLREEERLKEEQEAAAKKIREKTQIKKIKKNIKDGLYAIVGDKAITHSDIFNEIKTILILNNINYSEDKRKELQQMAVKAVIKRNIKEIAIAKNDFLKFNEADLKNNLNRVAAGINVDIATLKKICEDNEIDFTSIVHQLKTELLWNSLIFALYKDRVKINIKEIEEQLKLNQNKKEFDEFLISEIIINHVEKDKLRSKIEEIENKIKVEGFKNTAMKLSIASSAINGGDLGWLSVNQISKKFRPIIINTTVGGLSKPVLLKEGILIFMVRDKRKINKEISLEDLKNELVSAEKTKMLNMYSRSHYDNLRRTIPIKHFQ